MTQYFGTVYLIPRGGCALKSEIVCHRDCTCQAFLLVVSYTIKEKALQIANDTCDDRPPATGSATPRVLRARRGEMSWFRRRDTAPGAEEEEARKPEQTCGDKGLALRTSI